MSKQHHDRSPPPTDTTVLWFSTAGKIPPHAEPPRPAPPTRPSRPQPQISGMLLALCCLPLALALCVAARDEPRGIVRPRVSIHIMPPAPLCPAAAPTRPAVAPPPVVAPPAAEPPREPPPARPTRKRPRSSR